MWNLSPTSSRYKSSLAIIYSNYKVNYLSSELYKVKMAIFVGKLATKPTNYKKFDCKRILENYEFLYK